VFSEFSERFGIQPAPEQIRPSQDTEQTLDQLPVEILQVTFHIFNQSFILISFILNISFFFLNSFILYQANISLLSVSPCF